MDTTDEEFLAKGDIKDSFLEYDEVVELINNLPNTYGQLTSSEVSDEKFTTIIDKYQEQPHLLDPHLENLLKLLLKYIHSNSPAKLLHHAFKCMYLLTKTRGHKRIIRLFPHEVADLEPIMSLLAQQDPHDRGTWEVKYMLLLWLSMICLIPFDIKKFDSGKNVPLMNRIIDIGKRYLLLYADKCQESAALLLSKLLTRPDAQEAFLPSFMDWCCSQLFAAVSDDYNSVVKLKGALTVLALIFSVGDRVCTMQYAPRVLDQLQNGDFFTNKHSVIRKLSVKLVQRLGMTFLKPIIPKWRYCRGSRSLADTLNVGNKASPVNSNTADDGDDEYDVPDEIEVVIENLLKALYDDDTIVRWSAAKGIGRVTGRLPREHADEVVGSVLDCFLELHMDGAYHGGCLTLAELGRRGLLLPERLDDVVPMLLNALVFDIKRGACSIGANVRDSACYLAWSFARAYGSDTIAPYVEKIARTLLIVTAYDREINCRRAASAAFQENVGRQGQFPHGIDILTKADYFAVGSRLDSYLVIGPYIAAHKEYTLPFINHLCERKVDHWDSEIRWLAAKALNRLTSINPTYMANDVLEKLLPMCVGIDLVGRHGSIVAVAEIVHALFEAEINSGYINIISKNKRLKTIFNIGKNVRDALFFRGYGGEQMRMACCHLFARISQCGSLFTPPRSVIETWLEIIHDTLSNLAIMGDAESVCDAAINALSEINHITIGRAPFMADQDNPDDQDAALSQYLEKLSSPVEKQRSGYSQAIAALPHSVLKGRFMKVAYALIKASKPTGEEDIAFADARMHAIRALVSVCKVVEVRKDGKPEQMLCDGNVRLIYDALLTALQDYAKDSRGDVGSMVRLAGVRGLHALTCHITEADGSLLSEQVVKKLMCAMLQQACEKVHKVRDATRDVLFGILYNYPKVPHIPHHDELLKIFTPAGIMPNDKSFFKMLGKVLHYDIYLYNVLLGLIVSVGDLTQSLADASGNALSSYLEEIHADEVLLEKFTDALVKVFENHVKVKRVSVPLLKTLQLILQKDFLSPITDFMQDADKKDGNLAKFPEKLVSLVKQEIARTKDAQKILFSIEVFCGVLQFPSESLRRQAVSKLLVMLCHPFPKVRRSTATQLYEAVLTFQGLVEDDRLDAVMVILSDTVWDSPVGTLQPIRNELCELFSVPVPKLRAKK